MNNLYIELLLIVIILVYIFTYSRENYSSKIKDNSNNNILNNNNFEIYIINMPKNTDRLDKFNMYYNNSDIAFKKYNLFPAVIGKNLNIIDYVTPNAYKEILEAERTGKRKHHYELTRGGIGCYLSHLSIYKKIIESNAEYGIIFEDDSIVSEDFYSRVQTGLTKIPKDWDIFLFGLTCIDCDDNNDYVNVNRFWGTHSYMIKKKSAVKILEYLDRPLPKQIDADLSLLIKRKLINVYSINPHISEHNYDFESNIQIAIDDSADIHNEEFSGKIPKRAL